MVGAAATLVATHAAVVGVQPLVVGESMNKPLTVLYELLTSSVIPEIDPCSTIVAQTTIYLLP